MRRLFLVVLAAALLAVPQAEAADPPAVYAHRGGAGYAPENTMGAFRLTWSRYAERGVWLELDTQLTADGVPVVIHDDSLDRTTDCTGDVISKTLAELAQCNAAAKFEGDWPDFEPIPTLEQVLTEGKVAGWRLLVEIKNIPTEANFEPTGRIGTDEVLVAVYQTEFPMDRIAIQSFWPPVLERVEFLTPSIATALLTASTLPGAPENVGFYLTENAAFATARNYEISAPDFGAPDFSAETVAAAHAMGRKVIPYTINDSAGMAAARSYGVDGIITDRPDIAYGN